MSKPTLSCACEGLTDEAVVNRIVSELGAEAKIYEQGGKAKMRKKIVGFNNAAAHAPLFVLIDLDHDSPCPSALRSDWLPNLAPRMCFRIAVREVEAWLLADRERLASFLKIRPAKIPNDVENVDNPKRTIVDLARNSTNRAIREDIVPREGSGREIGPAYVSRIIEFIGAQNGWRPSVAAKSSRSLQRCLIALEKLIQSCETS